MGVKNRNALLVGAGAHVLWGFFPFYFRLLEGSGPVEIVAHRAVWSLVFCLLALPVIGQWRAFTALLRDRRTALALSGAGFLVAMNWGIYVLGVTTGRTLDASLGYFMNPLVSTLLGVIFLGERLRTAQWVAFGFGATAVAVLVAGYGEVPWIALGVALSWGFYALVKKLIGARVPALVGLSVETLALTPVGLGYLTWLALTGQATITTADATGPIASLAGIVTAVPLLMFSWAAVRLNLSTVGMLQYTTPTMLFFFGWLLFDEPMPAERWIGFALVWCAVTIFAWDAVRATRLPRTPRDV